MGDIAIRAEGVSKQYRLGNIHPGTKNFRESITDFFTLPFRRFNIPDANGSTADTFWALNDVSFEIKHGEVVGLIGRNGAGKSTLLKILSQITEPTKGWAEIRGRVGSLLEVGTGFHPELTGHENIFLNGAILGMHRAEIKQKFDEIVDFAGVAKFLDMPVKRYSSGMYVRLAFAVAAHLEPEILLVDEVLAVGDAHFQRKCLNKMQDVGQQGRTVLFVSHNMPAITRLCERALLLDQGQLLYEGPAHRVVSRYLRSDLGTSAVREWPDMTKAPGNDIVRLCAVSIKDEAGNILETADIQKPIIIEIQYYNFASDQFPYANVQLFDENNICLFSSGDFTNLDWRYSPRNFEGKVTSRCLIPGNFLAEGQIRVFVALTTHNPDHTIALEADAVSFVVVDHSKSDGARGEYAKEFPGVIRPLLEWQIDINTDDTGNHARV